jgi:glycosyltransferase involved in cell wall biosynthesis
MRKLRVLALQRESHVAPGVPSLSVAARVTEVLDYLQHIGKIDYTSITEADAAAAAGVRWADVVILSKHSSDSTLALARLGRASGKRLIYDIDDLIFSFPEYSGGKQKKDKTAQILQIIEQCDVVTVANLRLQEKIRTHVEDTVFVPNGMWVEKYAPSGLPPLSATAIPDRIVFTNADFIKLDRSKELLLTALQMFFIRHPKFVLDFYGDPFPEIVSLPFLHFTNRMPYEQYICSLISGHYALSITPLGASEDASAADFNACKNPFKYLNYGTAGIPGIYSASPIYTGCIEDGVTGLIVENLLSDWTEALESLAFDRKMRQRMREAAFEDIVSNHHVSDSAEALWQTFA